MMSQSLRTLEPSDPAEPALIRTADHFAGRFTAMAGPCEVLVDTDDPAEAEVLVHLAEREAHRIEQKFSRYRTDNVVHRINHSAGRAIRLDDETARLLDYAGTCYEMSGGLFDITSGALRRIWTFDGGSRTPADEAVREVLRHVGWRRVTWKHGTLTLPAGMEIDFGGLGKEYAVDRASALIAAQTRSAFLVNFGGDLFAAAPRRGNRFWSVGVDDPARTGRGALLRIELARGGLATSGDARRFVLRDGKRLGHILDPRTGWPVEDAPHSVTVLGHSCMEAGTLSTLAYLHGSGARSFLEEQGVQFWIL
jgi:thiamine biosynthesis lipoprotein